MVEGDDFYLYLFFEMVSNNGRTYLQEGPLCLITQQRRIQLVLDSNISFHMKDNGIGFLQCHVLDEMRTEYNQMFAKTRHHILA